jgi:hypothetical protein
MAEIKQMYPLVLENHVSKMAKKNMAKQSKRKWVGLSIERFKVRHEFSGIPSNTNDGVHKRQKKSRQQERTRNAQKGLL